MLGLLPIGMIITVIVMYILIKAREDE